MMPLRYVMIYLPALLVAMGIAKSRSDGRRLIDQGAVQFWPPRQVCPGRWRVKSGAYNQPIFDGTVYRVGKRIGRINI